MIYAFLNSVLALSLELAPYLLFGFLLAGIIHVWVPRKYYLPKISKPNFSSVVWAALFGIPLPICSCAVIPTSIALRREGASKGASVSFLIATPATGVDSILATYSLLGFPFALLRPVAALATSVFGGLLTNSLTKNEINENSEFSGVPALESSEYKNFGKKMKEMLRYGFLEMLENLGKWLCIGILLGALVSVCVPDDFFIGLRAYPILCMFLVLLVSMPMYTCAMGSIPLALSLIEKGITPGAALVMLMAGPAISFASIFVIGRAFGKKTLLAYLSSIAFGSLFFGFIVDNFFMDFFLTKIHSSAEGYGTNGGYTWYGIISLIILLACFVTSKVLKIRKKDKEINMAQSYIVHGMNCNHCKMSVEKAALAVEGVKKAEAVLSEKCLQVEGEFSEEKLKQAVFAAGFEFLGKNKNTFK